MAEPKYLIVSLTAEEEKRIFSHISIDPVTECWNWTGSFRGKKPGYGSVYYRGHNEAIHRLMYALENGPIPCGCSRDIPVVDHTCNNTHCCNPAHLVLNSQRSNILRGDGACANNSRKTHCPKGHPLPNKPDLRYGTSRRCPACMLEKRHNEERRKRKQEYDREYRKHYIRHR